MTSERIGVLMGLLAAGFCGACGSSSSLSVETDADIAAGGSSQTDGAVGGGGTGGSVETGGSDLGGSGGAGSEGSSGDLDRRIKSGTVAMDTMLGATTESCQEVIRLDNPAQSLTGYLQMPPASYLNSAKAEDPKYLYLKSGKNAVILPGPAVSYRASNLLVSAQLTTCVDEESACLGRDGYRVKVNESLSYVITIDDWEEEVALGKVELCLNDRVLTTEFVFAGLGYYQGGGVAHELTITPILDGAAGTPTTPVSIECRSQE